MILRQSIKSMIRTPKKTLLFLFLLILLAVFLNIGAGMYESARNMLLDADETYTTVVELTVQGDVYPDEVNFYNNLNKDLKEFDFENLSNHPAVKAVDQEKTAWAYLDDRIQNSASPLSDYAMVKVGSITKSADNLYMGIITETLFGKKVRDNTYIIINDMDAKGTPLNSKYREDHEYLFLGKIAKGKNPMPILTPKIPGEVEDTPVIVDLTDDPEFLLREDNPMIRLNQAMNVVDHSFPVTTVTSLEASAPYFFNEILLKEGRIFTPNEYQEQRNVILLSETLADLYQVKVGDTLTLHLHYDNEGIGLSDYLNTSEYNFEGGFEVVGILANKEEEKYRLYIPEPEWLSQEYHSTTLARYLVRNGTGQTFIEDNNKYLLSNMKFSLYDQGYEEAVKPIHALKNNAVLIIVLSTLSGIAILVLFSYLYVIKQKDTLKTMLSLGTGKKRTRNYILYGSSVLILAASTIGSLISFRFLHQITRMIFETMEDTYGTDLRYSERGIGQNMNFIPQVRVNPWLPVLVISLVLLFGLILLILFTNSVLQEDKQVVNRKKVKKDKVLSPSIEKANRILFGRVRPITLKFALVSLMRSLGRSFIVPVISILLSAFLIFLGLLSTLQQEKLDTVYDRIPVTAYITTYKNDSREISGLDLPYDIYQLMSPEYLKQMKSNGEPYDGSEVDLVSEASKVREEFLAQSEFIKDVALYSHMHYEYIGITTTSAGETKQNLSNMPNVRAHNNNYGYDWFLTEINKMPKLVYADDLRYTLDFMDEAEPDVTYLEGYHSDALRLKEKIGFISSNFAEKQGVKLGDTIRITMWNNVEDYAVCGMSDIKIVGIYNNKWSTDTIYMPWIMNYANHYYVDQQYPNDGEDGKENEIWNTFLSRRLKAATFTLKNTLELSKFRDYLEAQGYSEIGKINVNRYSIVIQDKSLVETVQSLKNHIRLIDTIKPILMILFGIIGFTVSYLLIKHRMGELAIMRSMGAKKRQVFFSFFLEQVILFFLGLIPVAGYAIWFPEQIALYGVSLVFLILCYFIGTAIALLAMNRAKILDGLL